MHHDHGDEKARGVADPTPAGTAPANEQDHRQCGQEGHSQQWHVGSRHADQIVQRGVRPDAEVDIHAHGGERTQHILSRKCRADEVGDQHGNEKGSDRSNHSCFHPRKGLP